MKQTAYVRKTKISCTLLTISCFPALLQAQIQLQPGQDIQNAVNAAPDGASFVLNAGVYRMQAVRPKNGQSFQGLPGAVMNGSRVLTSFGRDGSLWFASGQTQQGFVHGVCNAGYERCSAPEELFINSVRLTHATSRSGVGPGRWYFDYGADRIYFADDPTGKLVETSVTTHAFHGSAANVAIRGLTIEKYAPSAQHGAIHGKDGTVGASSNGWIVEDNTIQLNHGAGIAIGNGMQIRRNRILSNGQIGIVGEFQRELFNILVDDNELAYNNGSNFNWGWEGGATKFLNTNGLTVRNNHSHDNFGPGIWADANNIRTLYEGNLVERNGIGIFHEISYDATIRNNTVRRNSVGYDVWLWGTQILVAASTNVEVTGNIVEVDAGGGDGIGLIQQNRGSGRYGPWVCRNVYVHHNTISYFGRRGESGAAADYNHAILYGGTNRFDFNTYRVPDASFPHWFWSNGPTSFAGFRAMGQEANGQVLGLSPGDTSAPSVPGGVSATPLSQTTVQLAWSQSTDNVNISGYRIYRSGSQIATTTATSYTDTGLAAGTTYSYTIAAYDAAGNASAQSSAVSATTLPAVVTPPPTTPPPTTPPPTTGITVTGVTFASSIQRSGDGDNWHMTWAADDTQLTALCDGTGWGSTLYNTRLVRLAGDPANFSAGALAGYPYLDGGAQRWYGYGSLAFNGSIYQFIGHLEKLSPTRFTGAKLIYSPDNGANWRNADGSAASFPQATASNMFTFNAPGNTFSIVSVLQMGRNYEDNTDGYVYIYSPNGYTDATMRQLVMARVPKGQILNRAAYQYFVSRNADGSANWSSSIDARGAVHSFPAGWVGSDAAYSWFPSVAYNKALGLYMMAAAGNGRNNGTMFNGPSYLGIYTAPNPWGPWRQVHENTNWIAQGDSATRLYAPVIAPKWISADGRTLHLVFSDGKGWGSSPWVLPNYKFNVQAVTLTTQGSPALPNDTAAPVLSSVSATVTGVNTATISWSTNEPATAAVDYGLTAGYGSSGPPRTSLATSHTIALSNLAAGTTYHYRVTSRDGAGNTSTSGNFTFRTLDPTAPPPPPSTTISQVVFSPEIVRSGNGNNWYTTWSDDGKQYVTLSDASGWNNSTRWNTLLARTPDLASGTVGENVPTFPFIPESERAWIGQGLTSVDGVLYYSIGYISPSQSPLRFTGSRLIYSPDKGRTWYRRTANGTVVSAEADKTRADAGTMMFWNEPGNAFSQLSFLQFGQDNDAAVDPYVYIYAPHGWASLESLNLARVPKDQIADRSAWEYFVSRNNDGSANWSRDINQRGGVHAFPAGWVASNLKYSWHPSVVYNPALKLYLMTASGTGKGGGAIFAQPSALAMYSAPTPWGPWRQIYFNTNWTAANGDRYYEPAISPKWISADGRTLYLTFSGTNGSYGFNVQRFQLLP